jgi:tRNA threonylcarbamoyladenosine biosynthesis protein TsaB
VKLAHAGARGIGRGFAAYPELAALPGIEEVQAQALPDAREMARIGTVRLLAGAGMDPADLRPQYLRDKVALTGEERAALHRAAR